MASDRDVADGIMCSVYAKFWQNAEVWGELETARNVRVRDAIEAALAAEREACAKVAEEMYRNPNPFPTVYGAIAAAIRSRQTPTGTGETK